MLGGLGEKTTARGLNRATQSTRQTGSAIKPLAVLIPGIAEKKFTASTIYDDSEQTFSGGYSPTNSSSYLGKITVRRALESSQNIPFVEMMEEITPKKAISYLEKMGISTLTEEDENLALALGGLENGISPLEMAAAYATIANDGVYIEPTFYTKIVDKSGKTVMKTSQETSRVFSKQVAYVVKELLTQPVTGENGTATYCSISGIDVAAKTGTTNENYDKWLCGFTPYYTAVTWFGYDQNETIYYNNQNPAGIIWANVMRRVHNGLQNASFEQPSWIVSKTLCADTGKIANSGCTDTYTEYYLWGTEPDETCSKHNGSKVTTNKANTNTNTNTNVYIDSGEELELDLNDNVIENNTADTNNSITNQNTTGENNVTEDNNVTQNNTTNTNINANTNTSSQNMVNGNSNTNKNTNNSNTNANTNEDVNNTSQETDTTPKEDAQQNETEEEDT